MNLVERKKHQVSTSLAALAEKAMDYESAAYSPHTIRMYRSMWKQFLTFTKQHALSSLPAAAETISLFLTSIADVSSLAKLNLAVSSIEKFHQLANQKIIGDKELYRRVRKGIRRTHKDKLLQKSVKASSLVDLKVVCRILGESSSELRDKAILCVGFFGAMRRSEIVALNLENVEINEKGMVLTIVQSKTSDKPLSVFFTYGKDKDVCPVKALQDWLKDAQISSGPLFRRIYKGGRVSNERLSAQSIALMIKKHLGKEYSGHSLRRGLVTEAAENGIPVAKIKNLSRHKSLDMVIRYVEVVSGFEESSVKSLNV